MIFVDNSGADIILGILPFARELLRRGTQVCFCKICTQCYLTFWYTHICTITLIWRIAVLQKLKPSTSLTETKSDELGPLTIYLAYRNCGIIFLNAPDSCYSYLADLSALSLSRNTFGKLGLLQSENGAWQTMCGWVHRYIITFIPFNAPYSCKSILLVFNKTVFLVSQQSAIINVYCLGEWRSCLKESNGSKTRRN